MTDIDYTKNPLSPMLELSDDEIDLYLETVSFAISKGTANVSPGDMKKLRPLMRYYAKKKHPFTACVRDNRKRFGAQTEKYCAVLKDLIVGNTKWRGKGKKYTPKNLSQEELETFLEEIDISEIPEGFADYIANLSESDIRSMIHDDDIIAEELGLAGGDLAWNPNSGYDSLRRKVQAALNEDYSGDGETASYSEYWVEDITKDSALVCHGGSEYYVVPFSLKRGNVVLSEEEEWRPVEKAWVEANLAQDQQILAEMFFEDSQEASEEDGLIWKTIIREGKWKFSPTPGQKGSNKPITVTKSGKSDKNKLVISMEEIKKNFEDEAVEHVTIPPSHQDKVLENTGFIRALRIGKDEKGRAILEAGHDFTEPDVKEKIKRGSIANTSAGILFDYIHKESGKKFNAVLAHVSLTNHPWLNGMKPFGVEASEDLTVVAFSEENYHESAQSAEGGEIVSTTETETTEVVETTESEEPTKSFFDRIGLSEEEVVERLAKAESSETELKKSRIDSKVRSWQEAGKSPALVAEARGLLMADEGNFSLNLSEDGETKTLSLSEVVDRLVDAAPTVNLSEDQVNEQDVSNDSPADNADEENALANLSHDEKVEYFSLLFNDHLSEKAAFEKIASKRVSA